MNLNGHIHIIALIIAFGILVVAEEMDCYSGFLPGGVMPMYLIVYPGEMAAS